MLIMLVLISVTFETNAENRRLLLQRDDVNYVDGKSITSSGDKLGGAAHENNITPTIINNNNKQVGVELDDDDENERGKGDSGTSSGSVHKHRSNNGRPGGSHP